MPNNNYSAFKTLARLIFLLILGLNIFCLPSSAQSTRDTIDIYFQLGKSELDTSFAHNGSNVDNFRFRLRKLAEASMITGEKLTLYVTCSPEGSLRFNTQLVKERCEAVLKIMNGSDYVPDPSSYNVILNDIPWEEVYQIVTSSKGNDLPYRDEVADMVSKIIDGEATRNDLIALHDSEPWKYLIYHQFAELRRVQVTVINVDDTSVDFSDEVSSSAVPSFNTPLLAVGQKTLMPVVSAPKTWMVEIKTNVLYDIATVTNLGIEAGFCDHFSVDVLGTFSPWEIKSESFFFRTALIQPEFRYWFGTGFTGHFLGVHAHVGWYNVAVAGKVRYQDRNGNTPLAGAGITYGYVLPFNTHWGAEFSVGVGYAYLNYDKFYNIHNGAQYATDVYHYFGLTKLGVSIYYRF